MLRHYKRNQTAGRKGEEGTMYRAPTRERMVMTVFLWGRVRGSQVGRVWAEVASVDDVSGVALAA